MDITNDEMNEMVHTLADTIDGIRGKHNEPPIDRVRLNEILETKVLLEYGIIVVED